MTTCLQANWLLVTRIAVFIMDFACTVVVRALPAQSFEPRTHEHFVRSSTLQKFGTGKALPAFVLWWNCVYRDGPSQLIDLEVPQCA